MADTYCGKLCSTCAFREELDCPGCRSGLRNGWTDGCEIAGCCQEKGHASCETCRFFDTCPKLRRRQEMPQRIQRLRREAEARQAEEAARQEAMRQKLPPIRRLLGVLFALVIAANIADLWTLEWFSQIAPALAPAAQTAVSACNLAYSLVLLQLAAYGEYFRAAGLCGLVSSASGIVLELAFGASPPGWAILIALPMAIVALVGTHREFQGHEELLLSLRHTLPESRDVLWDVTPEKWADLWKWYLYSILAVPAAVVLALFARGLGTLLLLASTICALVISILKIVYLYRTRRIFLDLTHPEPPRPPLY